MKNRPLLYLVILLVLAISFGRYYFVKKESAVSGNKPPPHSTPAPEPSHAMPVAEPPHARPALDPRETEKLRILAEIFSSKNDNDPRMDSELKNLSFVLKEELKKQYADTKMEKRNERGTIAFLIGREVSEGRGTASDVEFLKNVLLEKPCMSLSDCSKAGPQSREEEHLQGIHETSANYPQLMDLRYLKQALQKDDLNPFIRNHIIEALEAARRSPNPRVVQDSQAILNSISK